MQFRYGYGVSRRLGSRIPLRLLVKACGSRVYLIMDRMAEESIPQMANAKH